MSTAALPRPEERPTLPLWPDVGKALGIGRSSVYELAARGDIPGVIDLGRRRVVATAALRRWLQMDEASVAEGAPASGAMHLSDAGGPRGSDGD